MDSTGKTTIFSDFCTFIPSPHWEELICQSPTPLIINDDDICIVARVDMRSKYSFGAIISKKEAEELLGARKGIKNITPEIFVLSQFKNVTPEFMRAYIEYSTETIIKKCRRTDRGSVFLRMHLFERMPFSPPSMLDQFRIAQSYKEFKLAEKRINEQHESDVEAVNNAIKQLFDY